MQGTWRKDNSKNRCYNCQKLGHIASECRKPKKKISGQAPPSHQNNLEVNEQVSNHDVEYISFGVVKEVNDDKGTVGTVVQVKPEAGKKSPALMVKPGVDKFSFKYRVMTESDLKDKDF
ncbi:hypothetical protein DYB25_012574 [Aphanomyces astaci]|uniref:CCHC-type domain-containing protein n=2 Tax=Aphanomyces astaci TaxID=112090 RepID=A0A397BXL6_APHAT|nr:hypothetical protein DYB25_012574 [Aphanomyces astaci]RHY80702.1 hypothetical protein DYB26_006726 [Aphanomyces astaci]